MNQAWLAVMLGGFALLVVASVAGAHEAQAHDVVAQPSEPHPAWILASITNGVMVFTFFAIAAYLWKAIYDGGQLTANPLLTGMALIFTTCAIGHGMHVEHTILPYYAPFFGLGDAQEAVAFGTWAQTSMAHPLLILVDIVTAGLAIWYFTTRRLQAELFEGAELSEDLRERELEARRMHDSIVQSTSEALLLLQMGDEEGATEALDASLQESKEIVDTFLSEGRAVRIEPGDLKLEDQPQHGRTPG